MARLRNEMILELVAAYRVCAMCKLARRVRYYLKGSRVCQLCKTDTHLGRTPGMRAPHRNIILTEKGRAAVAGD